MLDAFHERGVAGPMRCEREAALGVIGRTLAVESPEISRQNVRGKFITLAPPAVPDTADIIVAVGFVVTQLSGQQTAQTEQTRLNLEHGIRAGLPMSACLGEVLHGPGVVFVAERTEQSFPQRLFPSDVLSAGAKVRRFVLETDMRSLIQQRHERGRIEFAQRSGAFAEKVFGQSADGIVFEL